MPRFIFITKTEQTYNFGRENIFITNIIHKNEIEQDLIKKIQKELWEIDCYYNERVLYNGKSENNLLNDENSTNISINILITGISRSGKSTFINIINNSLISLENEDKSSTTKKVSEYDIFLDKKSKNGSLKFIDTPGFNSEFQSKDKLDLKQINKNILDLINDYKNKNSFDKIHFVLFFFNEGSCFSGIEEILKSFANENYYVLFIINRVPYDEKKPREIKSIKKFLKNNDLKKLAIEENIITCNIIHRNENAKGYGINKIFKRIYNILKEKNNFYFNDNLLNDMKKCNNNMIEIIDNPNQQNEFEKYLSESIKYKKQLSEMNELFDNYIGEEKRIEKGKMIAEAEIKKKKRYGILCATMPIPYIDLMFVPFFQAKLIKDIIKGFDISIFELDLEQFIRFLFIGGGREGVHIAINKCMKKNI